MATPWQRSYDVTLRLPWKSNKDYDSHIATTASAEASKMRVKPVAEMMSLAFMFCFMCQGRCSAAILLPLRIVKRSWRFDPGLLLDCPDQFP